MSDLPGSSPPPRAEGAQRVPLAALILWWSVAATGAGLFLFARERMSPLISTAVCWHIAAGMVISALLVASRRLRGAIFPGRTAVLFMEVLAATGVACALIPAVGVSLGRPRLVFGAHVAAGFLALFVLLAR